MARMIFSETITHALGFFGEIPIGRAELLDGQWRVEIFHKSSGIKAASRREVRLLLAVHGADRVEMIHQVRASWPPDFPSPQKNYSTFSAWQNSWRAAF